MFPGLIKIDHIHIHVTDRPSAELWYRDVLGFRRDPSLVSWVSESGPLTLVDDSGNIHLALFQTGQPQNTVIAFAVTARALVEWMAHLAALGVEVEPVDHDISWSIYFRDPDGNPFEITTYDYAEFKNLKV